MRGRKREREAGVGETVKQGERTRNKTWGGGGSGCMKLAPVSLDDVQAGQQVSRQAGEVKEGRSRLRARIRCGEHLW